MAETLSVNIDTSKDNAQPSLEEEAAKYDEAPVASEEQRPDWLPEKFKSAADMAKAYGELEKKLGSKNPPEIPPAKEEPSATKDESAGEEETTEEDTSDKTAEEQARDASEKAGLDFDDLSAKYWEKGELAQSDYEALEKSGIPKAIVDQFIAGQEALLKATTSQVYDTVGGESTYNDMTAWAADNLGKEEVQAYNNAVNSGDMNTAMMAVKGLHARYTATVGYEPARTVTGAAKTGANASYRSIAELEKDMGNPKYKTDPAFRKDVENKLSRSDIF